MNEKNIFDNRTPPPETTEERHIGYDELLKQIYVLNVDKKRLYIRPGHIKTTKDLYKFCLDLFCKGIFLCCKKDDQARSVRVEDLCMEDIQIVINKLACTGIITAVRLMFKDPGVEDPKSAEDYVNESYNRIETYPEDQDLSLYMFSIKVKDSVVCITFDVTE